MADTTEAKSLWTSKTFWVNLLVLVAGVTGYVGGHELIQEYPSVVAITGAVVGGINIVLRLITTQPVK